MSYDSLSQGKMSGKRNVSSVRTKTVVRGFSSESDKLLDFLVRMHVTIPSHLVIGFLLRRRREYSKRLRSSI